MEPNGAEDGEHGDQDDGRDMEGRTGDEDTFVTMTGKEVETSRRKWNVGAEERKKILDYVEPLISSKKVPGQKQCHQYVYHHTEKSALEYIVYSRIRRLKK